MSYADLPLVERKRMAADFVLLLLDDERPVPQSQLISELSERFHLSTNEAIEAYIESRRLRRGSWLRLKRNQMLVLGGSIFVVGVFGLGYWFFREEGPSAATGLGVFSFFLTAAGFVTLAKQAFDSLFFSPSIIRENVRFRKQYGDKVNWRVGLLSSSVFFSLFFGWMHFTEAGIPQLNQMQETSELVYRAGPQKRKEPGKNGEVYHSFYFRNSAHEFRLEWEGIEYAPNIHNFKPKSGDTLFALLDRENMAKYRVYDQSVVRVANIRHGNTRLVYLEEQVRDKRVLHRRFFWGAFTVTLISLLLTVQYYRGLLRQDR